MATAVTTPATLPTTTTNATPTTKGNRGKDQIHWSAGVWNALDHAVIEEMIQTRVLAKVVPLAQVEKKQTNVASDVVNIPTPPTAKNPLPQGATYDPALSVDEAATKRINQFSVPFKLHPAQVDQEEHDEMAAMSHHPQTVLPKEPGPAVRDHHTAPTQRATTGISLAKRAANVLAQAEDLVLFNGQNAVVNSPLFINQQVQFLDPNLKVNLDLGLLNIDPSAGEDANGKPAPAVTLPGNQVITVSPSVKGNPPRYAENTLNAVALAYSTLLGGGLYGPCALFLNTYPFADLHSALPNTLIEPIEPISHIVKAGIYGTGALPPFSSTAGQTGLPLSITDGTKLTGNVLFTGTLLCLSGDSVDLVRGTMDGHLDVVVTFNQKDVSEDYRFMVVERFCLRLKDLRAIALLLFMDQ